MKMTHKKNSRKSRIVLLSVVIAVILIALAICYLLFFAAKPAENTINYNPPTNNERQDGVDQKEKNQEREAIDQSSKLPSTANVVISDASQYDNAVEIRGYVDNVYEDGGKCTATFTLGSVTVTKSNPIIKDAKTLQCGALDFDRSQFSPGTWQMTLTYTSSTVQGRATKEVEIK